MDVENDLVSIAEAATRTGYSVANLTTLHRQGKLAGRKIGRIWAVRLEAIEAYRRTNPRPGRKPRAPARSP